MADNKTLEVLLNTENKKEAEDFMQFMRGMDHEKQTEFTYLLKGVKIGMGLAAGMGTA
jgi:hypothetical protein